MLGLQYVAVVPAGGGKTKLSEDPYYLDIDNLYNLKETQSTYDRMNAELIRRVNSQETIDAQAGEELRTRLQEYQGPAQCLLVHSLAVARQSELILRGVYLPSQELHEEAIATRGDTGKWFARRNSSCIATESKSRDIDVSTYGSWSELQRLMQKQGSSDPTLSRKSSCGSNVSSEDAREKKLPDEELLLQLLTAGIGCEFV